jgi:hypothetical protein
MTNGGGHRIWAHHPINALSADIIVNRLPTSAALAADTTGLFTMPWNRRSL